MRRGIISAGNWLVDQLKFITAWPEQGNLTNVVREESCLGGCSHNVLADLAAMEPGFPLYAGGCVGNDANGDRIIQEVERMGINARFFHRVDAPTSYTDVMIPESGSTRTFFHNRGANSLLDMEHFKAMEVPAKIFHVGYLLLLDKLDAPDEQYGVCAARVLDMLQKKGYLTSVDVVSEQSERFPRVVLPCLPYTDYLIVNEIEAGACFSDSLRTENGVDLKKVETTAARLMNHGVGKTVVIHFPEGGYALDRKNGAHFEPSKMLKNGEIISTVGAGDAFCAGMLYALHEDMALKDALLFANTSARFNLRHATCTGGAPKLTEIRKFIAANYA